jgi:hypothetical protein
VTEHDPLLVFEWLPTNVTAFIFAANAAEAGGAMATRPTIVTDQPGVVQDKRIAKFEVVARNATLPGMKVFF